jgi:hypothetical protein
VRWGKLSAVRSCWEALNPTPTCNGGKDCTVDRQAVKVQRPAMWTQTSAMAMGVIPEEGLQTANERLPRKSGSAGGLFLDEA